MARRANGRPRSRPRPRASTSAFRSPVYAGGDIDLRWTRHRGRAQGEPRTAGSRGSPATARAGENGFLLEAHRHCCCCARRRWPAADDPRRRPPRRAGRGARLRAGPHRAASRRAGTSEHHFPKEELRGLAALGCYGVAVPTEWDGAGLDYLALARDPRGDRRRRRRARPPSSASTTARSARS